MARTSGHRRLRRSCRKTWTADGSWDPEVLAAFCAMDDNDVMCCIKAWQDHPDFVLSDLSRRITQRRLFKIELRDEPFNKDDIAERIATVQDAFGLSAEGAAHFVIHDRIDNRAYSTASHGIRCCSRMGRFAMGLGFGPLEPECPERSGGAAFPGVSQGIAAPTGRRQKGDLLSEGS